LAPPPPAQERAGDRDGLGVPRRRWYEGVMETRERTFNLRLSIVGEFDETSAEDDALDGDAWLAEWEAAIKPELIRAVFTHLRSFPAWHARVRNRGLAPTDEVEIVVTRRFVAPPPSTH
jgi:hypothetical protein